MSNILYKSCVYSRQSSLNIVSAGLQLASSWTCWVNTHTHTHSVLPIMQVCVSPCVTKMGGAFRCTWTWATPPTRWASYLATRCCFLLFRGDCPGNTHTHTHTKQYSVQRFQWASPMRCWSVRGETTPCQRLEQHHHLEKKLNLV